MKRLIAALSIAVLAAPAFAAERGAPFEQTELDRAQPDVAIKERPARVTDRAFVDHNFVAPAL
jgi:hypothetical protein